MRWDTGEDGLLLMEGLNVTTKGWNLGLGIIGWICSYIDELLLYDYELNPRTCGRQRDPSTTYHLPR